MAKGLFNIFNAGVNLFSITFQIKADKVLLGVKLLTKHTY